MPFGIVRFLHGKNNQSSASNGDNMIKHTKYLTCSLLLSSVIACSSSPHPKDVFSPTLNPDTQAEYDKERQKVMNGQKDADFTALRMSYTGTKAYAPWDSAEHEAALAMLAAQEDGEYQLCLSLAKAILQKNYTSLDGHFGSLACRQNPSKQEDSDQHRFALEGLMKSIRTSGNGQSPESAFVVISATEMRAFIRFTGLLMYREEAVDLGYRELKKVFVLNPETEESREFFFDTTPARLSSFRQDTQ